VRQAFQPADLCKRTTWCSTNREDASSEKRIVPLEAVKEWPL